MSASSRKLSSSLKERLKRCGRYHSSPVGTPQQKRTSCSVSSGTSSSTEKLETFDSIDLFRRQEKHAALDEFVLTDSSVSSQKQKLSTLTVPCETCSCPATPVEKNSVSTTTENSLSSSHMQNEFNHTPVRSKSWQLSNCRPSRLQFCNDNVFKTSSASQTGITISDKLIDSDEAMTDSSSPGTESLPLLKEYESLKLMLCEKEEELRKLNMVKMYRAKNDLEKLGSLIKKWKITSQQALVDLHTKLPEPKPSLSELINHLQIEHHRVGFNPEDETFS